MSGVASDDWRIGHGRSRPQPQAVALRCPACASPLERQDERAKMVVCAACGEQCELGGGGAVAIGKTTDTTLAFQLELGHPVTWEGGRYEVAARLAYREEDDTLHTFQYMLYSPRRGTLWLEHYGGNWNISWPCHARLDRYPFSLPVGARCETFDGNKWRSVERGAMFLQYVDGALPWVARYGDRVRYADFVGPAKAELQATLTDADELELSVGKALTPYQVREITGKERVHAIAPPESRSKVITRAIAGLALAVVALFSVLVVGVQTGATGHTVLREDFPLYRLTDDQGGPAEVYSQPFQIASDGSLTKLTVRSGDLDNAWMSVDLAFVRDDAVVHVSDLDLSYYHGVEGGESWTEGSKSSSRMVLVPKAGRYKLLVRARSARGMAEQSIRPEHTFRLTVEDGVKQSGWAGWAAILIAALTLAYGALTWMAYKEAS